MGNFWSLTVSLVATHAVSTAEIHALEQQTYKHCLIGVCSASKC